MEGVVRQTEGSAGGFTVIVWHAPDCPPPPKLLAALADRQIAVLRVQSAFRALAEVCRRGRSELPALIVVHPEMMANVVQLWEARSRYAPAARLWMYGPSADPKLRAIVDADITAWGPKPEIVPQAAARPRAAVAQPKLKLAGEGQVPPGPPESDDGEDGAKPSLLSPEELRMLLGDDEPPAVQER